MRRLGLLLAVLLTGCGAGFQNGGTGELAQLGAIGAMALAGGLEDAGDGERARDYDSAGYPPDAYFCRIDAYGGREVRAPRAEEARARCLELHGARRDPRHCACVRLEELHPDRARSE